MDFFVLYTNRARWSTSPGNVWCRGVCPIRNNPEYDCDADGKMERLPGDSADWWGFANGVCSTME